MYLAGAAVRLPIWHSGTHRINVAQSVFFFPSAHDRSADSLTAATCAFFVDYPSNDIFNSTDMSADAYPAGSSG